MCVVCYSPQYMLMCTVDMCSVLQCTVYGDVYNRYVQCVTVRCISWCVQSICAVCYSLQYTLMCTVDVCSLLQSTVYADLVSVCCLTMKSLPNTVNLVPIIR